MGVGCLQRRHFEVGRRQNRVRGKDAKDIAPGSGKGHAPGSGISKYRLALICGLHAPPPRHDIEKDPSFMNLFNRKTLKRHIETGKTGPIRADHLEALQAWAEPIGSGRIDTLKEVSLHETIHGKDYRRRSGLSRASRRRRIHGCNRTDDPQGAASIWHGISPDKPGPFGFKTWHVRPGSVFSWRPGFQTGTGLGAMSVQNVNGVAIGIVPGMRERVRTRRT